MAGWSWGKDPFTGFLNVTGNAIGDTIYNTATNGWGSSNAWSGTQNAWNTYMNPNSSSSSSKSGSGGGGRGSPSPVSQNVDNSWAKESAALNAQIAALQNQLAQAPKLPNFDILANYNKAKQTATSAVNPLFDKKLNIFLEGQGIKKTTKTNEFNLGKENNQMALNNALEDNQTSRIRTGEDLASALDQIGQGRDRFLEDDANAFNQARRGLQEDVAAAGATDTGLGQQQIDKQLTDRNTTASRQIEDFSNQEAAKKLLATRTIDDLATSDTRAGEKKTQDDKALQIDFDSYMDQLANDEKSFTLQNDLDRALEIARQTQSNAQQGVAQFIAGLAGQGWRAQDIALAKQVYM